MSPRPATPRPTTPKSPLDTPYTLNGVEDVNDIGSWQLWWEFNKDPYLGLDTIDTVGVRSNQADFYLGNGQQDARLRGGRASQEEVRDQVLPALYSAISSGGKGQFGPRAMMAIAKAARGEGYPKAESLMRNFLKLSFVQEDKLAALALGVLESDDAYPLLHGLAFDTSVGRELNAGEEVEDEVRAFAAYGLGLLGHASNDRSRRARIVDDLVRLLEDEESADDVRIAAMISTGLVPLEIEKDAYVCTCGTCKVEGPETSLQSQVTYLMRYFTARKEFDTPLRAHAATALARLLEDQSEQDLAPVKEAVAGLLIGALDSRSGEPAMVRESCVLALGLLGDADADATDRWIRWALNRAVAGTYLERRFALVSIGLVGSRKGRGETPFEGTSAARNDLVHHLTKGRRTLRPWAAMGLGVMGHWLRAEGQEVSHGADLALRNALRSSKRASDMGAYAIAVGMRRDSDASEMLVGKAERGRDDAARAYAVIGLGMVGDRGSIEVLGEMLSDRKRNEALTGSLGLALGLLGDPGIVAQLTQGLAEAETDAERRGYITALGGIGDSRSIEALSEALVEATHASPTREAAAVALGWVGDRKALPWRTAFVPGTNYSAAPKSLTNSERTGVLDVP